ncbi:MAG: hypothetical protein HY293_15840 [Planctomycetes bacterium]|nr:hypothetical protein [Planctomycetota bacterium]
MMAHAQGPAITTTGPSKVVAGSTSAHYTATIYMPVPSGYRVRLWVFNGANQIHYSETIMSNPGVPTSPFAKDAGFTAAPNTGDVLKFQAKLKVGTLWYDAADWFVTVTATRPTKPSGVQATSTLALQSVDRDRRRE